MRTITRSIPAFAGLLLLVSAAHASSIAGDNFSYQFNAYGAGVCDCVYDSGGTLTAPGTSASAGGVATIILTATELTIQYGLTSEYAATTGFNGLVLTDLSNSLAGYTVSLNPLTTIAGYSASDATVNGNEISFNFQGLNVVSGSDVVFDLNAPAVTPEPSSLVLLGTGMLGVVGLVRRRFAA